MKIKLLGLLMILTGLNCFSQNLSFYGLLPAISQTGKISNKLNYNIFVSSTFDAFNETIAHVNYPASDLQFYLQPSLIYQVKPRIQLAASYTFQRNNPISYNYSNEHRFWAQSNLFFSISKGKLNMRLRYEERFIENRLNSSFNLASRLRMQLGYNLPLNGPSIDPGEFYFNTYNESYFSLAGIKNSTYSENWTYFGFGYDLGKMGRLELGYLNQIFVRNLQHDLRILNLAQILWITHF
jgi:hypothetical protein